MSTTLVKRAFKYRFYPTELQAQELLRTFGCVRLVFNKALQIRTAAWHTEKQRVNYEQTSAMLTAWKREPELSFLREVSSVPLQQTLRHLQVAFANFSAKQARYPRFKSRKRSRASAEYTRSAFLWRDGTLTLSKMTEPLNIVWSRPLPDGVEPSTVTVTRDPAGRWFVSLRVEAAVARYLPGTAAVGVDAGIVTLLTVDQWLPSSKTCSACGMLINSLPLHVREWICPRCGKAHDRDVNAARNILAAGLAAAACGDGVRPSRHQSVRHLSRPPFVETEAGNHWP